MRFLGLALGRDLDDLVCGLFFTCNALLALADLLQGPAFGAPVNGAVAVAVAIYWRRRNKGKRRRAAAWLGAKSKALRAALVKRMQPAPKPRWRPVPQGAGR